jgi:hypothetical protein
VTTNHSKCQQSRKCIKKLLQRLLSGLTTEYRGKNVVYLLMEFAEMHPEMVAKFAEKLKAGNS